jgi:hypothetical protein
VQLHITCLIYFLGWWAKALGRVFLQTDVSVAFLHGAGSEAGALHKW